MSKTSSGAKIGLVVFGIVAAFVLMEIGMRATGLVLIQTRELKNLRNLKTEGAYTIMFLGESTTDSSYPDFLINYLKKNRPDKKISGVNKARSGTNSSIILAQLEDNLETYRPDMVIVMMGANDDEFIRPCKIGLRERRGEHLFKVCKLLSFIKRHYESRIAERETHPEKNAKAELSKKYLNMAKNKIYSEHDYVAGRNMLEKAVSLDRANWQAHTELGIVYFTDRYCEKAIASFKKAIKLRPDNYRAYGIMGYCYDFLGQHELAEECFEKANLREERFYDVVTEYNYRRLTEMILSKGIELVCVQYPKLSAEPLKRIIEDREKVILVDNEKSFKDAVAAEGYNEYFMDNFAGEFGHCTDKGNKLLAQNIVNAILENSPSF